MNKSCWEYPSVATSLSASASVPKPGRAINRTPSMPSPRGNHSHDNLLNCLIYQGAQYVWAQIFLAKNANAPALGSNILRVAWLQLQFVHTSLLRQVLLIQVKMMGFQQPSGFL